jgi:pyrroline-5-carboxylate reductase
MTAKTIGFIGGGRITRVFLGGWRKAETMPAKVVVSDIDAQALARIKESFGAVEIACDDNAAAMGQDVVLLALHPPAIPDALGKLQGCVRPASILVSLAPKLTLAKLSGLLGGFDRLVRVIPNAPSIVGAGFNPVAFSSRLTSADRVLVKDLLSPLGEVYETAEEKLEAFAVLTGMGPTYFWPLLYELVALGESFGLTPTEASAGMRQMLAGTVATMFDSGLDAKAVQDLIPVKPLADMEQMILDAYRTKLKAVFEKIKP